MFLPTPTPIMQKKKGQKAQEHQDSVTISTVHAAKGLEWDHVFVVGVVGQEIGVSKSTHAWPDN